MGDSATVVDANLIIRPEGLDLSQEYVITPKVESEINSQEGSINLTAMNVEVRQPSETTVEAVKEKSEEIGSSVSPGDVELAALAMEKQLKLLTDDLDLQNLCVQLGVEVEGVFNEIEETRRWRMVCPVCGHELDSQNCSNCGYEGSGERKPVD